MCGSDVPHDYIISYRFCIFTHTCEGWTPSVFRPGRWEQVDTLQIYDSWQQFQALKGRFYSRSAVFFSLLQTTIVHVSIILWGQKIEENVFKKSGFGSIVLETRWIRSQIGIALA